MHYSYAKYLIISTYCNENKQLNIILNILVLQHTVITINSWLFLHLQLLFISEHLHTDITIDFWTFLYTKLIIISEYF